MREMSAEKTLLPLGRDSESSETSDLSDSHTGGGYPNIRTVLVVSALAVSLAFSITSLSLSIHSYVRGSSAGLTDFCVPVELITLGPPGFDNVADDLPKLTTGDGQVHSCAHNQQQLDILTNLLMDGAILRETAKYGCPRNMNLTDIPRSCLGWTSGNHTAAAHIVLNNTRDTRPRVDFLSPLTGWSSSYPGFQENVKLTDDRLRIQNGGLYYIYSQATVVEYADAKFSSGAHEQYLNNAFVHHLNRWNIIYPGEETLLKHSASKPSEEGSPFREYVSYVGGVVTLRAGDQLYVITSDGHQIESDHASTFFGLYRLPTATR